MRQPTIEQRKERADKVWRKLKYDQRRVLGQLCSIPPSWKAILDREDEQYAMMLSRHDLVDWSIEDGCMRFKASTLGRDVWYVLRTFSTEQSGNE